MRRSAGLSPPLGRAHPYNPLVIVSNSGHAAYGNTHAIQRAGITKETLSPVAGEIVHDADGNLTGAFLEVAAVTLLVVPVMADTSPEVMFGHVVRYLNELAAVGITSISDQAYDPKTAPLYQARFARQISSMRVRAHESGGAGSTLSQPTHSGDDFFRLIGVKYWADGSPWQGNIAVSVPYLNTPVTLEKMGLPRDYHGGMNYTKEQIAAQVAHYVPQGYQFLIHAHGDLTLDVVLDVYETQLQATPRPDYRLRLKHCGCMTDAQFARAARLGVTTSLFMAHVYY